MLGRDLLLTLGARLSQGAPLASALALDTADTLKVSLTATDGGRAKRPHQAFVVLREEDTGLEVSFPLSVKGNGKGAVEIVRSPLLSPLRTWNRY